MRRTPGTQRASSQHTAARNLEASFTGQTVAAVPAAALPHLRVDGAARLRARRLGAELRGRTERRQKLQPVAGPQGGRRDGGEGGARVAQFRKDVVRLLHKRVPLHARRISGS